jgi:protein-arginine kinase
LDKKDFDENSKEEKSTQTLVDEQKTKIVEKLKKKLSASKSAQMRHGKINDFQSLPLKKFKTKVIKTMVCFCKFHIVP